MDLEKIRQLAAIAQEFSLTRLELDGEDIVIERIPPVTPSMPAAAPVWQGALSATPPEAASAAPKAEGRAVKASMIGVFYAASAPGEAPFVAVGDSVKTGDTLCIIEAMKLMNEIVCECDGTITEVCAENGQVVEYGQVLFRLA